MTKLTKRDEARDAIESCRTPPNSRPARPPVHTIPARMVFYEANAALAPLPNRIQMAEQLRDLVDHLYWIAHLVYRRQTKACYGNRQS